MRLLALVLLAAACGDTGHHLATGDGPSDAAVDAAGDAAADGADASPDAHVCIPTNPPTEVCDGVDNDCDGLVDNVDVGGDGIYDCQKILLLGSPGAGGTSDFEAWLGSNGTTVTRQADPDTIVDATLLAGYDIVIVDHLSRTYSSDEAAAIQTWVGSGGGLMALSGYTGGQDDCDDPNSLVSGIGAQFSCAQLFSTQITQFTTHPTTNSLTDVDFEGGFAVAIAPDDPPVAPAQYTASLMNGSDNVDVAVVVSYGKGRMLLWGDEWVTFDSEWSGSAQQILQFWVDAFGWLGGFT